MEQLSPMDSKAPARSKTLLLPVLGLAQAVLIALVGGIGVALGWNPSGLPHLFLGCLVGGLLMLLLLGGIVIERTKVPATGQTENKSEYASGISPPPWAQSGAAVCEHLHVQTQGLGDAEASERLERYGSNVVESAPDPGYLSFFCKEIYEPTQLLLLSIGVLYIMFGSLEEGATAFTVIFLMAGAEVWTEWRAKKALSKLEFSAPRTAIVKRGGNYKVVNSTELVPGDIIQLRTGMEIPADVRLLQSESMEVDESKLTGESALVPKTAESVLPAEATLFEWTNVLLAGTCVHGGTGTGIIYGTGATTYLGQILRLAGKSKEKKTKLQKHLKQLAGILSIAALVASILGALVGIFKHMRWQDVILSALSLAFATIPEELPILIAAVLAVGSRTLSLQNVYVKHLRAAENLAFVNVVLTDKTGTLTENRLVLNELVPAGIQASESERESGQQDREVGSQRLLEAWLFMSEYSGDQLHVGALDKYPQPAITDEGTSRGPEIGVVEPHVGLEVDANVDMFDRAVIVAVGSCNLRDQKELAVRTVTPALQHMKEDLKAFWDSKSNAHLLAEIPFDSGRKFAAKSFRRSSLVQMANANPVSPQETFLVVKGAPEILLRYCSYVYEKGATVPAESMRTDLEQQISLAASKGFRLVGYASQASAVDIGNGGKLVELDPCSLLKGCTYLGFLTFEDPIREGVIQAIGKCHEAGVRVLMVTGDHVGTALSVAHRVGIVDSEAASTAAVSCGEIDLVETQGLKGVVARTNVFGRATPTDKLTILKVLQAEGNCVMAAGDGVNDAPILAQADVGMAMGKGTDIARKAASIVVADDNFSIMPYSLAEGRRLLDNLRKALAFYLGAKLGLLCLFMAGTLWQSFPLQPIQIIVLELFMDLGASSSFVLEPADDDIMSRNPPSHSGPFFDSQLITGILVSATSMVISVFGSFSLGIHYGQGTAQTCAFEAWLLAHVMLALNMKTLRQPVTRKGWLNNSGMCIWLLAAIGLATLTATFSHSRLHLKLKPLPATLWLAVLIICLLGTFWIEIIKLSLERIAPRRPGYSRLEGDEINTGSTDENTERESLVSARSFSLTRLGEKPQDDQRRTIARDSFV